MGRPRGPRAGRGRPAAGAPTSTTSSCGSRARASTSPTPTRARTVPRALRAPLSPGAEIAGVVEEDGGGFRAGERVVALVGTGGYAEYVAAPAATTVAIPDDVSDATALALLLQGLTAWHLYETSREARRGRERRRARRGRRGRLARGPARQAARRGARDRDRLDRGEARARARARRRRGRRRQPRGPAARRCVEANLGARVDVVLEMAGGARLRREPRGARAVRPARAPTGWRRASPTRSRAAR